MTAVLAVAALLVGAYATRWGADRLAEPVSRLRRRLGLSVAAGASIVALATATPEVATNTVSAVRGVSGIGLGNLLGSDIVSVPLLVATGWLAYRTRPRQDPDGDHDGDHDGEDGGEDGEGAGQGDGAAPEGRPVLTVGRAALTLQVVPFLVLVALVAVLTVPAPWRGLQPVDAVLVLLAYVGYVVQAALRDRTERERTSGSRRERWLAVAGATAVLGGAFAIVRGTEELVGLLGIQEVVGGLFLTATASVVPEVFATWALVRAGELASGTTVVVADNFATLSLGFVPLALAGTAVGDLRLYVVNLVAVAGMAALLALGLRLGRRDAVGLPTVLVLVAAYAVWVAVVVAGPLTA